MVFVGKNLGIKLYTINYDMSSYPCHIMNHKLYLQPSAFRRPSSLLPVCRLQKAFVSKMSLCKSRACIKAYKSNACVKTELV